MLVSVVGAEIKTDGNDNAHLFVDIKPEVVPGDFSFRITVAWADYKGDIPHEGKTLEEILKLTEIEHTKLRSILGHLFYRSEFSKSVENNWDGLQNWRLLPFEIIKENAAS
jgi:hypothetical protein